jgi:hypothetical protein
MFWHGHYDPLAAGTQPSFEQRKITAHLLSVAIALVFVQTVVGGVNLPFPAGDKRGWKHERPISLALTLVVHVSLPPSPTFMLKGSQLIN